MCESKCNAEFFKIDLAKTKWRSQVVELAIVVKDKIWVARGQSLI